MLGLHGYPGFSLAVQTAGCSLVAVLRLFVAVPSPVTEHGLQDTRTSVAAAPGLRHSGPRALTTGSILVAHSLSCPEACGIFPDQQWNPCLPLWGAGSFPLEPSGKPQILGDSRPIPVVKALSSSRLAAPGRVLKRVLLASFGKTDVLDASPSAFQGEKPTTGKEASGFLASSGGRE